MWDTGMEVREKLVLGNTGGHVDAGPLHGHVLTPFALSEP